MTELMSGLTTDPRLDAQPPHLLVRWVAWDSPFRGADIRVGDRIVAVRGRPFSGAGDWAKLLPTLPGQLAEAQGFEASRLKGGDALTVRVRRRAATTGWLELDVTAPLAERQGWRNEQNQPVLGPGGPVAMDNDGFGTGSWQSWYEGTLQPALARALDPEQRTATFVTRAEGRMLREPHAERVAFALARYAGPWASALKADWDAALAVCDGTPVTLAPAALDYRRRGEELAAQVREEATAAWNAFQAAHAHETVPAFPAPHPVRGDASAVAGKVVVLPPLGNADWVADAHHGWFAAGSGEGWYFIDAQASPTLAMQDAQARYRKLVDADIAASWEFVARVSGEARLVVVGERAHFGLVAQPLAVLVGGAMFVDLTQRDGKVSFAGEAALADDHPALPPDDAAPADVMAALVGAVKSGDLPLWRALHASWWVEPRSIRDEQGRDIVRQVLHPGGQQPDDAMFEASRRSIMGRVLDVRVAWTGDPVVVLDGERFEGASVVEQVDVTLAHVGSFDGDVRTFADVTVREHWALQRVNGGPWRVATCQPI
jgi:hypothetical protein